MGEERDLLQACKKNVRHGLNRIQNEFHKHPEIGDIDIRGAVYDIFTGKVEWLTV